MDIHNNQETPRQMDKKGMRVFIGGTVAVYSLSLLYCYNSGHLFETGMVGTVMLGLGIFIWKIYRSA
jgi:hypothetical protein